MKRWFALALLAFGHLCVAQTAVTPIVQPRQTYFDSSGTPCSLCKLSSFVGGTSTPLPTYADSSGVSQNPNPITLDVAGSAQIWLSATQTYKFVLKDALGATIWTVDNVRFKGAAANQPFIGTDSNGNLSASPYTPVNKAGDTMTAALYNLSFFSAAGNGTGSSDGAYLMWNAKGGDGETDFVNYKGVGIGGFKWFSLANGTAPSSATPVANIDPSGSLFAIGSVGSGGNFIKSDQGAYLMWNLPVGSGATGFVNYKGVGNGGFNWYNLANGATPTSPIATLTPAGEFIATKVTAGNLCYTDGTQCPAGVSVPSTSNLLAGNGTGGVVNSGISPLDVCQMGGNDCNGIDYYWTFTSCANSTGQPSRCTGLMNLPGNMPDDNYQVQCSVNPGSFEPSDQVLVIHETNLPISAGGVIAYAMVQVMQNGTTGGHGFPVNCHAHHA